MGRADIGYKAENETRLNSLLGESGSMSLQERETKAEVIK